MTNYSTHRLLLPETIWLETEDYEKAENLSKQLPTELKCWQSYLNLLGLFGLETWLTERLSQQSIANKIDVIREIYYLQVGSVTVSAIAVANLLDEMVRVSSIQLHNHPTHFYALLEVNEETEEAIFRGLLRRDHLETYLNGNNSYQLSNGDYSLPLSWFDPEPNHLISYCCHLTAATAIALLPQQSVSATTTAKVIVNKPTKLSQWLQNTVTESWLTMESLLNPELSLAFNTRSVNCKYKRGKLINLGVALNQITVTLIITVIEEAENKLRIKVQLYPANQATCLPPGIKLTLLSKAGKTLQTVQAREQDNFIQLKSFKGQREKKFSLEIALEDLKVTEDFEF